MKEGGVKIWNEIDLEEEGYNALRCEYETEFKQLKNNTTCGIERISVELITTLRMNSIKFRLEDVKNVEFIDNYAKSIMLKGNWCTEIQDSMSHNQYIKNTQVYDSEKKKFKSGYCTVLEDKYGFRNSKIIILSVMILLENDKFGIFRQHVKMSVGTRCLKYWKTKDKMQH